VVTRYYMGPTGFVGRPSPDWDERLARPVVVIDPEDREQVAEVVRAIRGERRVSSSSLAVENAQKGLRSLLAPPKPPEPTGLGAVVEDARGCVWVRAGNDETPGKDPWRGTSGEHIGWWSPWGRIDAVRVLSEGVQP
jgi:hypothetical protein